MTAWLRRLHRRFCLALLRGHYAQIKCACEQLAMDTSHESGRALVSLTLRGIEVRKRIELLERHP